MPRATRRIVPRKPNPMSMTLPRGCLAVPLAFAMAAGGCADSYLVPTAPLERARALPASVRERTAVAAVRQGDQRRTWVFPDLVKVDPEEEAAAAATTGQTIAHEANSRERVSWGGLAMVLAGAGGLALGTVFAATDDACVNKGVLPCISGSGEFALPAFTFGAGVLLGGVAAMISRAFGSHPAEARPGDDSLLYLGGAAAAAPAVPRPTTRTPME